MDVQKESVRRCSFGILLADLLDLLIGGIVYRMVLFCARYSKVFGMLPPILATVRHGAVYAHDPGVGTRQEPGRGELDRERFAFVHRAELCAHPRLTMDPIVGSRCAHAPSLLSASAMRARAFSRRSPVRLSAIARASSNSPLRMSLRHCSFRRSSSRGELSPSR